MTHFNVKNVKKEYTGNNFPSNPKHFNLFKKEFYNNFECIGFNIRAFKFDYFFLNSNWQNISPL